MSLCPRISLKPEVTEYLKSVFLNKEVRIYLYIYVSWNIFLCSEESYISLNF